MFNNSCLHIKRWYRINTELIFDILMGVVLAHALKAGHNMIKRDPESKAD
ncbi:hypothetical protein AB4393_24700 [Vibrio splendidus]|nr:hypothetical protein VCRA2110O2_20161 [Vibrio crassostreae]CAK3503588.1 hypothetical protein VCRA2126E14_20205 [Vibrio crassostreae]